MAKYLVELKQPEGVGESEMKEHIATAVRRWGGGGHPADPFFDIGEVVCRKVPPEKEAHSEARIHQLEKTLSTMERELKEKTELLFRLEQNQKPTQANPAAIFLREVANELERGRKLFPGDQVKGLALAEEFGELIKALLDEPGKAVWKEAVQTAAMAARVAIDGDGSVDDWRQSRGLDEHRLGGLRRV